MSIDEHNQSKSDTDSGRSSCHEHLHTDVKNHSKEAIIHKRLLPPTIRNPQLKVDRFATLPNPTRSKADHHPVVLGGQGPIIPAHPHEIIVPAGHTLPDNKKLQVVRRRDIILKKRNISRRNTIDLNQRDFKRAQQRSVDTDTEEFEGSKSATHLDRIKPFVMAAHQHLANRSSMPELDQLKAATLPLRVRRNRNHEIAEIQMARAKGPEFILNAGLPVKQLDVTDSKCTTQMRRLVSIIHLSGQQLHVICNATTTTVREIFESVLRCEGIVENFFLGLCVLIGGDFVFLPPDLKVHKAAPQMWITGHQKKGGVMFPESIIFTLFMRIKFFLPTLRGVR